MTLTIEQLREELAPMRQDVRELRTDMAKVTKDVADARVKVASLPTRDEMRQMVVDKTDAMKGHLIGWIVGTGLGMATILGFIFRFVSGSGA